MIDQSKGERVQRPQVQPHRSSFRSEIAPAWALLMAYAFELGLGGALFLWGLWGVFSIFWSVRAARRLVSSSE
jgi:hypothetical protein